MRNSLTSKQAGTGSRPPKSSASGTGRQRQKARTRRQITEAAARLRAKGRLTSLGELAGEAEISKATVYRYFSSIGDLNAELALAVRLKEPEELLGKKPMDPLRGALEVHAHLFDIVRRHEPEFRAWLKASMEHWERRASERPGQIREGRRAKLLDAAIRQLKGPLTKIEYERLVRALSLVTFIEPYILLKDIFGLSDAEADRTMRWTIETIIKGALSRKADRRIEP